MERLIVLGAPWSGKNTLTNKLKDEMGYEVVEAGGLIREACQIDPTLNHIVSRGEQLPVSVSGEIVSRGLDQLSHVEKVALNGFPRQVENATRLEDKIGAHLTGALYLDIPEDKILERYSDSANDRGHRNDSGFQVLQRRLQAFYSPETEEVLEFYDKRNKLLKIDAGESPDQVWETTKALLLLIRAAL